MAQSDAVLFKKWQTSRDADAFATLLSRHAGMVYGACMRVLRNPGMAEEVTQECFMELMKGPPVAGSLGGWLHTVATRRALDRAKSEGRRREREQRYAVQQEFETKVDWDDSREYVDEAIAALPEGLRDAIVLRFLEGRTHVEIAEALKVSRSAVRQRIEKGIASVRDNLARRGVIVSIAALSAVLESARASDAPTALVAELGRRALAMRLGTGSFSAVAAAKLMVAPLALAGVVVAGFWIAIGGQREVNATPAVDKRVPEGEAPGVESTVHTHAVEAPDGPVAVADGNVSVEISVSGTTETEAAKKRWVLDLTPAEDAEQQLGVLVSIDFRGYHAQKVLNLLQSNYGLNLVLDSRVVAPMPRDDGVTGYRLPREFATDGRLPRIYHRDKPLDEVLAILATSLGLTYKVRGNVVWVSSSAQITRDMTVPLPAAPFVEAEILEVLARPVRFEFEEIHVFDILDYLRETYEFNVVADTSVIMPEVHRGEEPPLDSSGYTTDGMIGHIFLEQISLAESLYVLTRLLDLAYRVDRDGVYITTPDRIRARF